MSEEYTEGQENEDTEKKIPITTEDFENVRKYCKHFGEEIPEGLEEAMQRMEKEWTYENMLNFKLEICKWIATSEHSTLQDPLWEHPKKNAKEEMFDLQFDKDVKNELGEDESE